MKVNKGKGILYGLICLFVLFVPRWFPAFALSEGWTWRTTILFRQELGICLGISAFVGLSVALKSKLLIILSSLLASAVFAYFLFEFIYYNSVVD